jgi:hypothetical protein
VTTTDRRSVSTRGSDTLPGTRHPPLLRRRLRSTAGHDLGRAAHSRPRSVLSLVDCGRLEARPQHRLVQGQAALFYPPVAAHATSVVASPAFLAEPTFAPGGGLAKGAAILIQT